jgi:hypothetical protein
LKNLEGFASSNQACSNILIILFGFLSASFGNLYALSPNVFLILLIPSSERGSVFGIPSYFPILVSPQLIFTSNVLFFVLISVISNVKNPAVESLFGGNTLGFKNGIMILAHFSNPYLGFSPFSLGVSMVWYPHKSFQALIHPSKSDSFSLFSI